MAANSDYLIGGVLHLQHFVPALYRRVHNASCCGLSLCSAAAVDGYIHLAIDARASRLQRGHCYVARPRLKDIYTWPLMRDLRDCNAVTVRTIAAQDDELRSADDQKEALAHARCMQTEDEAQTRFANIATHLRMLFLRT